VRRVMATMGTTAIAAVILFGTAAQANASQIKAAGPYSTLATCNYSRKDMAAFGVGVHNVGPCTYYPARDVSGRYVPPGYFFSYLVN
jgi:hypothetical protein